MFNIIKNVEKAAIKSGRQLKDITIIAVSKTKSVKAILNAADNGYKIFGESRVQEALQKIEELRTLNRSLTFHMIGKLQTNKVKQSVGVFDLIQSVDRDNLLSEIDKQAYLKGIKQKILIQINLAGEKQKGGVRINDLDDLIKKASTSKNIILKGFMMIPPDVENPVDNLPFFIQIKDIFDKYKPDINSLEYISAGMSGDYDVAIQSGANMVRIGSAIFGGRN